MHLHSAGTAFRGNGTHRRVGGVHLKFRSGHCVGPSTGEEVGSSCTCKHPKHRSISSYAQHLESPHGW